MCKIVFIFNEPWSQGHFYFNSILFFFLQNISSRVIGLFKKSDILPGYADEIC